MAALFNDLQVELREGEQLRMEWKDNLDSIDKIAFATLDKEDKVIDEITAAAEPYRADLPLKENVAALSATVTFKSGVIESTRLPLATVMAKLKESPLNSNPQM